MVPISVAALKSLIVSLGYKDIQSINTKTFNVLVDKPKDILTAFPKIFGVLKTFGAKTVISTAKPYNPEKSYIEVSGLKVFVIHKKSKKVPKHLTFGRENEQNFFNIIKEHINAYEKINIEFQVEGRTEFLVKNIVRVMRVGKHTANRQKADIHLFNDKGEKIPISLKQLDASYWESPDSFWGELGANVIDYAITKEKTKLQAITSDTFRLTKSVAIPATREESKELIFGNDLYGKGAIVIQTWKQAHVKWDDYFNTLVLDCHHVMRTMADLLPEDEVYFQIRNHSGKKSKYMYPGLALLATKKSQVRNDVILPDEARKHKIA